MSQFLSQSKIKYGVKAGQVHNIFGLLRLVLILIVHYSSTNRVLVLDPILYRVLVGIFVHLTVTRYPIIAIFCCVMHFALPSPFPCQILLFSSTSFLEICVLSDGDWYVVPWFIHLLRTFVFQVEVLIFRKVKRRPLSLIL